MKTLTINQQQRRERILTSARDQLARLGYEGVNMRDLAVAADVSTSTLYNLYQSKDTLILAALEDLLMDLNEQVVAKHVTGLDRYLMNVEVVADQIVATPSYADAMTKMLFNAEANDPVVKALVGTALSRNRMVLQEMSDQGELAGGVDPEYLARELSAIGWSTILIWMKGYIALHDFKKEFMRSAANVLLPWVSGSAENKLKAVFARNY